MGIFSGRLGQVLTDLSSPGRPFEIYMNQLRYIRYSRKSSEAKERQALSITDQNSECDKYALQTGLNITHRLEESKSAFKPHNRPEFDTMIDLIRTKQVDAILTWKPDRLCRNPEEGGLLLQLLQDGKIQEIRTATGDVYTQESDHLVLQIHFGMANQYSRNLSQNVKRGLNHKAERGEYPRSAPLGYEGHGDRGKRVLKPHPFEGLLIKEAFELAKTRLYSLDYIGKYLFTKGLKTKSGKRVSKSHVYKILTSSIYYGYFYHHGELFKGNFEPLISKTLFDEVQIALTDRSKPKNYVWKHHYNGIMRCATCGCAITTTVKQKYYKRTNRKVLYSYHHCTKRRGHCDELPITTNFLENEFLGNISRIQLDEEVWQLGIKLLKEKHKHETEQNIQQLNHFQADYKKIQEKLNKLIDMRANEELTKEEFMSQKEFLLKEQARIEALMNDNKNSAHNWLELAEKFLNVAFYARNVMQNGKPEDKRDLITTVGENLCLKDGKVEFSFKKPYDVLLLPEYRTNVLPRVDSNHEPSRYKNPSATKRLGLSLSHVRQLTDLGSRCLVSTHYF